MNIKSAKVIYFSPTQTTKKIVQAIGQGTQISSIEDIDLTFVKNNRTLPEIHQDQLLIIGSPVYSGRVPVPVISKLQGLKGDGGPAIIAVLYGNRAYEDALIELRDKVTEAGFKVTAAAAFIGEHSYSNPTTPVAAGRPDTDDIARATAFGRMVLEKLSTISASHEMAPLSVPGNNPYKERAALSNISPDTIEEICTKCEQCASVCPTGVITVGSTVVTDKSGCIRCCACVKICPTKSRVMQEPRIQQFMAQLTVKCSARKEPETYL
jgi:ferredoxin